MPLNIRLARVEDAPLLPAVERSAAQSFIHHHGLEWIAQGPVMSTAEHLAFIDQGHEWVLVDPDDQPQGFLCATPSGADLFVHELSVAQHVQGQGHGRRLINTACQWAREHDFQGLTLTTFAQVPWNAPFYARLGFALLSEQQLSPALHQQLTREQLQGLTGRCAMRLDLQPLS
ncbi:GNAT family N-acetyltransferase [Pseudomonas donghuensis]|uniref:GNAT family N-acetyltransferase n=1 Tax=Pseudomonas donghuensis TaxID=1163398 RepID=UPI0020C2176A|nr:GNAT family N-acetyltransferase [Pseudomonas donghuensis]MCP6698014.1 GNAT family N-acetyltransferase [Pseudomonas donghuensis]